MKNPRKVFRPPDLHTVNDQKIMVQFWHTPEIWKSAKQSGAECSKGSGSFQSFDWATAAIWGRCLGDYAHFGSPAPSPRPSLT